MYHIQTQYFTVNPLNYGHLPFKTRKLMALTLLSRGRLSFLAINASTLRGQSTVEVVLYTGLIIRFFTFVVESITYVPYSKQLFLIELNISTHSVLPF